MLTPKKKLNAMKEVMRHEKDTGSPEVQVSILTRKIAELTSHLKIHKGDNHSRRGLLQMVVDRRSHLKYLEKGDKKKYATVTKKLGLK